jgi:hypothetical protein
MFPISSRIKPLLKIGIEPFQHLFVNAPHGIAVSAVAGSPLEQSKASGRVSGNRFGVLSPARVLISLNWTVALQLCLQRLNLSLHLG